MQVVVEEIPEKGIHLMMFRHHHRHQKILKQRGENMQNMQHMHINICLPLICCAENRRVGRRSVCGESKRSGVNCDR